MMKIYQKQWIAAIAAIGSFGTATVFAQGAGIGVEGSGTHRSDPLQGGGGLGACGSGPQGSGMHGDYNTPERQGPDLTALANTIRTGDTVQNKPAPLPLAPPLDGEKTSR